MHIRKDLGPNSFLLAFGDNSNVADVAAELVAAITEKVNGVSRYGYEDEGLFKTVDILNSGVYRNLIKSTEFGSNGVEKKVVISRNDTTKTISMEIGYDWISEPIPDSIEKNYLLRVAQLLSDDDGLGNSIKIPDTQFSIYVFLSKDWLLLYPKLRSGAPAFKDKYVTGALGYVNTCRAFSSNLSVPYDPKCVLFHTSMLSASRNYIDWSYTDKIIGNGHRGYTFYYPSEIYRYNFGIYYNVYKTYTHTGIISSFGAAFTDDWWNSNQGALFSNGNPFPPNIKDKYAATLRGRINYSRDNPSEFSFCGIKIGVPDHLGFLDRVSIKCDSDYFIDAKNGVPKDHYVIDGQCKSHQNVEDFGINFKYLIPC